MNEPANSVFDADSEEIEGIASTNIPSGQQQLFLRYFTAVLIDLVVLNLFAEYWSLVTITSFSISLIAAIVLQVLLKASLTLEHHLALFFKRRDGMFNAVMRWVSAWLVLFLSKFFILFVLEFTLGDALVFGGPVHGVVVFIVVVMALLAAEELVIRFYRRLA